MVRQCSSMSRVRKLPKVGGLPPRPGRHSYTHWRQQGGHRGGEGARQHIRAASNQRATRATATHSTPHSGAPTHQHARVAQDTRSEGGVGVERNPQHSSFGQSGNEGQGSEVALSSAPVQLHPGPKRGVLLHEGVHQARKRGGEAHRLLEFRPCCGCSGWGWGGVGVGSKLAGVSQVQQSQQSLQGGGRPPHPPPSASLGTHTHTLIATQRHAPSSHRPSRMALMAESLADPELAARPPVPVRCWVPSNTKSTTTW